MTIITWLGRRRIKFVMQMILNYTYYGGSLMKQSKRRLSLLQIIGILLILTGVGMMLYQTISTQLQQQSIQKELESFLNAPNSSEKPSEGEDISIWGALEIPALDIKHPVVATTNWYWLDRYVVAYPQNYPNEGGNFAMAAHNGRCAACVFKDLKHIQLDDEIILTTKTHKYVYKVRSIKENVFYTDTSVLESTPGKQEVTLITCMLPNDYDEYRLIVSGDLVETIEI